MKPAFFGICFVFNVLLKYVLKNNPFLHNSPTIYFILRFCNRSVIVFLFTNPVVLWVSFSNEVSSISLINSQYLVFCSLGVGTLSFLKNVMYLVFFFSSWVNFNFSLFFHRLCFKVFRAQEFESLKSN